MALLTIDHVSRLYHSEDGDHYALKNVSFTLPSTGMVGIIGKSGSGKSTLLNMIALLDKPTEGFVYYNNQNINALKEKEINCYRSEEIGIIFQHYNLLENESVLYNIMLPALIKGIKEKVAKEKALDLLSEIAFKKELYEEKCCNLSGGEKQRVAVLRSIINSPSILLADEPTGALDSKNSIIIMNMLKKISNDRLVIVVSHNVKLLKRYVDKTITIVDGSISKIDERNVIKSTRKKNEERINNKTGRWVNHLAMSGLKKHRKRNIFSIASLIVGLTSSFLIIGFSINAPKSIQKETFKQFSYGALTISKENKSGEAGKGISIVRMSRPTINEIKDISKFNSDYEIELNLDTLLPPASSIKYKGQELKEFTLDPIYDFSSTYIDFSLQKLGKMPRIGGLDDVLINYKAYTFLKDLTHVDPIGTSFVITHEYESTYYDEYLDEEGIKDYYSFNKEMHIVGVCEELNFLSTPKIYYSYLGLKEYLSTVYLNNLSTYFARDYSWIDRVDECQETDPICSYSYRLFHKNYKYFNNIKQDIKTIEEPLTVTCSALIRANALFGLVNAASKGMTLFLFIALLGTILIMGIVSFSFYTEDKKSIAILSCLGANRNDITNIYSFESIFVGIVAFVISILISPLFEFVINLLIKRWIGFSSLIKIPLWKYNNIPFILPLIVLMLTLLVSFFSSAVPILLSKKISLKEELKDE